MPFTDAADNILGKLTEKGRQLSMQTSLGVCWSFYSWAIGRGGYDMLNPVKIEPLDLTATSLIDQIYPSPTTRKTISSGDYEFPSDRTVSISMRIPREEVDANYGIGEIGLWVKILDNPLNPLDVGNEYLFAIAHKPIETITFNTQKVWRFIVNF